MKNCAVCRRRRKIEKGDTCGDGRCKYFFNKYGYYDKGEPKIVSSGKVAFGLLEEIKREFIKK